jgi:hypothetical protein
VIKDINPVGGMRVEWRKNIRHSRGVVLVVSRVFKLLDLFEPVGFVVIVELSVATLR